MSDEDTPSTHYAVIKFSPPWAPMALLPPRCQRCGNHPCICEIRRSVAIAADRHAAEVAALERRTRLAELLAEYRESHAALLRVWRAARMPDAAKLDALGRGQFDPQAEWRLCDSVLDADWRLIDSVLTQRTMDAVRALGYDGPLLP